MFASRQTGNGWDFFGSPSIGRSHLFLDTAYGPTETGDREKRDREKRDREKRDREKKEQELSEIETTVCEIEARFAEWYATGQSFIGDQQFLLAFLIDTPEKPFRDLLLRLVDRYPADWLFPIASCSYRIDLLRRIVRAAVGFPNAVTSFADKSTAAREADSIGADLFKMRIDRLTRQWFEPALESLRPVAGQIDDEFCQRLLNWNPDPRLLKLITAFDFNPVDAIKLFEEFGANLDPEQWMVGVRKPTKWLKKLKAAPPTHENLLIAFRLLENSEDGVWFREALRRLDRKINGEQKTVEIDSSRSLSLITDLVDQQQNHRIERERILGHRLGPPSEYRFELLEELMAERFVELYLAVLATEKYPLAEIKTDRLIFLYWSRNRPTPEEQMEMVDALIDHPKTVGDASVRRRMADGSARLIRRIGLRLSPEKQVEAVRRLTVWNSGWEMFGALIAQQLIEVTDDRFFHWLIDHQLPIPPVASLFWSIAEKGKFHCLPNQPDEQNRRPIDRLFDQMVGKSTADESVFTLIDLGAEWEDRLAFLLTQPWFRLQPTQWRQRAPASQKIFEKLGQMITARPAPKMLGDYEDCVACFGELDERVIFACGHATLCFPCFLRLQVEVCPICRGSLKEAWTITPSQAESDVTAEKPAPSSA